jgi:hypothetical protein
MLKLVFSPKWFYGKDIIIDIFSIIVLLLIATFSIKCYNLNKKNKNYFWFAFSFILLSISFLFKILTNFTIYYNIISTKKLGLFILTYKTTVTSDILFSIGFLGYTLFGLLGLFILYEIYQKSVQKQHLILSLFFILIISYFGTSKYFVFHLTSLLLLSFITISYYRNYLKKKTKTSKSLWISFSIITISQLVFIFVNLNELFYVLAEIIQLIGYILLLTTFIGVVKNAKKK